MFAADKWVEASGADPRRGVTPPQLHRTTAYAAGVAAAVAAAEEEQHDGRVYPKEAGGTVYRRQWWLTSSRLVPEQREVSKRKTLYSTLAQSCSKFAESC